MDYNIIEKRWSEIRNTNWNPVRISVDIGSADPAIAGNL